MPTLNELVVRISADTSKLERELKRVNAVTSQSAKQMQSSLGGLSLAFRGLVPAISIAALGSFTKQAIDAGDRLNDLSARTGVAASTLSQFALAAKLSDTSLESVGNGIRIMQQSISAAVNGSDELTAAFSKLQLSADDLRSQSPDQAFLSVVEALNKIENPADRAALRMQILGRAGYELGVLIDGGAEKIRKATAEAERLGMVLSDEEIFRLGEFNDAWDTMTSKLQSLAQKGFLVAYNAARDYREELEFIAKFNPLTGGYVGNLIKDRMAANEQERIGDYYNKAKSGGFVTNIDFSRPQSKTPISPPSGDAPPAEKMIPAESKLNDIQRERARLIEMNMTAEERYAEGVKRAREVLKDDQVQLNRELTRLWEEYEEGGNKSLERIGDQSVISAKMVKDSFADALESAMFDFQNFGNAAGGILEGIARNIARQKIIDPLSNSIMDGIGGLIGSGFNNSGQSGLPWQSFGNVNPQGGIYLGNIPGFANGGNPPVGVPSMVGEDGPELIVPRFPTTVIPNHALGGTSHNVSVVYNIASGVTRAELASMMPALVAQTRASVFSEIERGGKAAATVGRKQ